MQTAGTEGIKQGNEQPSTGCAEGMTQGNGPPIDVHFVPIPIVTFLGQFHTISQSLGGKGLVEFNQVYFVQRPTNAF
jgi:hypothetical protein